MEVYPAHRPGKANEYFPLECMLYGKLILIPLNNESRSVCESYAAQQLDKFELSEFKATASAVR